MDISSVITVVATMQGEITISSPVSSTVVKVWPDYPPQSVSVSDSPTVMNEWIFDREDRTTNGLREQYYTDHMQLFVYNSDSDVAAAMARAFMAALVDKFDTSETLEGTCSWTKLRGKGGNSPLIFPVTWAGFTFVGLDLFLDIRLTEAKSFGGRGGMK